MADDALHGREGTAQRALDLVDGLVDLDHAHRRRRPAMKINDFAGLGVAHPHIVDVVDRGVRGKARQRRGDRAVPAVGDLPGKDGTMPHVIVKLWPGKSEKQKSRLADEITKEVMAVLNYGEESVSVAMEEVAPGDWLDQVYKPDILGKPATIYKKPGYDPASLT